jgi:hypothetical protein
MRPAYDPAKGIYSAGIEAYEEADNHTQVEFLDGYDPEWPLRPSLEIGAPFVEFCDWVLQELRAAATPETTDLRHQLAEARKNLQLIEERKSQYVMETDIPLQLIKCEQRLLEHIAELEQRIERSGNSDAGT